MTAPASNSKRPRIIIVGGGFAGVAAARALRHADAEVVLIDRRNHYIFQPLLYQVATAVLSAADISAPLRQLETHQGNLNVLLGEVTGISLADRTLELTSVTGPGRRLAFDYLIVATGTRSSYFGHDEFAPYAPGLKNLSNAETIRARILSAFESAESTEDDTERDRLMTFVVVGGGAAGVELVASLAQLVQDTLRGNFRRIDPAKANIVLVEGATRILPTFSQSVSIEVTDRLEKIGVQVVTDVRVEKVGREGVKAGALSIPSATVLWTAGVAAAPLAKMLGESIDRAGRVLVDPFLQVPSTPGVFVVGDAAALKIGERLVPGVAQAAIQEGSYVGHLIARQLAGQRLPPPFSYFDKGNMVVVGRNYAILERGRLRISGFLAWCIWVVVHILSLPQSQNRMRVRRQWLWSYLTGQRGSRVIPES